MKHWYLLEFIGEVWDLSRTNCMKKLKVAICANEISGDEQLWIDACDDYSDYLTYEVIQLASEDWIDKIKKAEADWYLLRPGAFSERYKKLYDERVLIMEEELNLSVFPDRKSIFIYENKRYLSYWLEANNLPHPKTRVFYNKKEADLFIQTTSLPIVAKSNIGASGAGVQILKNRSELIDYTKGIFTGNRVKKRVGPNFQKKKKLSRLINLLKHPSEAKNRLKVYKTIRNDEIPGYVIFQEYIEHEFEWRVVRIGDSYFAHKKLKIGDKASGSLDKGYENPPLDLLNFVKEITDRFQFFSQAIDLFQSNNSYLINEVQCIFGQSDPYQMMVDGLVGRYRYQSGNWIFEEGNYNKNQSYNLRIEYLLYAQQRT